MTDTLYDLVVSLLNCPQCNKQLVTPAVVCSNGHATCAKCSEKSLSCILCESLYVTSNHTLINSILTVVEERQDFLNRLIQTFECPICYNQIRRCDICVNGHGVCRECAILTQHCPLCREPYVYNFSSLITSILAAIKKKLPCSNWPQCKISCVYYELIEHEAQCDKNLCFCILQNCDLRCAVSGIKMHTIKYHSNIIIPENVKSLDLQKNVQFKVHMLSAFDDTFWLVYTYNSFGLTLSIQVHKFYSNYKAQIILNDKDELKYTYNVLTLKDHIMEAIMGGSYLHIPYETLEKFNKDENIKCHISIVKSSNKTVIAHTVMTVLFVLNVLLFCTKAAK